MKLKVLILAIVLSACSRPTGAVLQTGPGATYLCDKTKLAELQERINEICQPYQPPESGETL